MKAAIHDTLETKSILFILFVLTILSVSTSVQAND